MVFHPLFVPLFGSAFYLYKAPRFIPDPIRYAKLFVLFILTIVLPVLVFLLLKTLKKVNTIYLEQVQQRITPFVVNTFILFLILVRVITPTEFIELYYFFVGILITNLVLLILAILRFKASVHMAAFGGLMMFFIAFSIHFKINIVIPLTMVTLISGAVGTSRLHLMAHTNKEVLVGFVSGLAPQLLLVILWL